MTISVCTVLFLTPIPPTRKFFKKEIKNRRHKPVKANIERLYKLVP